MTAISSDTGRRGFEFCRAALGRRVGVRDQSAGTSNLSVHASVAQVFRCRKTDPAPLNIPDQANDPEGLRPVLFHPPSEVFKRGGVKFQVSQ